MQTSSSQFETRAVHGGMDGVRASGSHVPVIDFSTTNPLGSVETGGLSYEELATGHDLGEGRSAVYQRLWHPGVARFEESLAGLEGTEGAVAFSSGMAALAATLIATARAAGDRASARRTTCRPPGPGLDHRAGARGWLQRRRPLHRVLRARDPRGLARRLDSLVQHPASLTHRPVAGEAKPGAGIVRISIGLEHVEDMPPASPPTRSSTRIEPRRSRSRKSPFPTARWKTRYGACPPSAGSVKTSWITSAPSAMTQRGQPS
ncbi:PLP-dependent transferase [Agromyces bauzanensis]|uniref:PLP-dependent transferase n=1 Tax=Agromyces bauzanensis TaxID=1308924 RepID=A0A917PH52_9MICO|nr:hypothetical protein GCM10011372_14140 [Agromyces bauzanensis]